jgi:pimeloyl-ACP methyl ester carboxylesterase
VTLLGAEHGFLEVEPHEPAERRADLEVVLLLHGLGGHKQDWSYPAWRSVNYDLDHAPQDRHDDSHFTPPLYYFPQFSLSEKREVSCWTSVLLSLGHTVIYYDQDGRSAPIEQALDQFENLIVPFIRDELLTNQLAGKRVVLLCHSRGGILARYYLARHPQEATAWVQRAITLHSPHAGTNAPNSLRRLADEAVVLSPFPPALYLLGRLLDWFSFGEGAQQLLPDNPLFGELSLPADTPDIEFRTFGGTSVTYSGLYWWYYALSSFVPNPFEFPPFDWTLSPLELDPISPLLDQLPDILADEEQREGQGDGLVTNDSARLPGVPHQSFPLNHAEALFDERLFAAVADILETPLDGVVRPECTVGFIGNTRTLEVHDPTRETRQCQLDEIVSRRPFKFLEDASAAGYDGCFYCLRQQHRR